MVAYFFNILETTAIFIGALVLGISFIAYWIAFLRLIHMDKEINSLYEKRDKEIRDEEGRGTAMPYVIRKQAWIREQYTRQIEPLERKRRFLLDKIPFLRK